MAYNVHTPWTDDTRLLTAEMIAPLSQLDKAITYDRNLIVCCDGDLSYDKSTGVFSWSAPLRIIFNREDGQDIANTVATGSITLADNEFAYVDLSETNNAARTAAKAAITTGTASNFLAVGRVVLGYRNTTSDEFYAVRTCQPIRKIGAAITDVPTGGSATAAANATAINSILAVLRERKIIAT